MKWLGKCFFHGQKKGAVRTRKGAKEMNLLVTGAWNCTSEQLQNIEKLGNKLFFLQNEKDELPIAYEDVEGVICNGLFLHHPIEKFKALRYIQLTSAGFDRVPMNYVKENNIQIFNARGVYSVPMAEFALFGVLQIYKQGRFFHDNQKIGKWEKHRGLIELLSKTVCIVGCGSVGTECAKRFLALGCKVFGVDLFPRDDDSYETMYPLGEFDDVVGTADVLVLTLPLTDETKHLISRDVLGKMKDGSVLVNIARGAIVDTKALMDALEHKLLGAVLDVFEEEPLAQDSPLWDVPNVVITPHNSFVGDGNGDRLFDVIYKNLSLSSK